ncbi:MAG: PQQ-binding-like beta-propeller repeat protein, partial [Planctomycetales bacterium]|nr:PQQ-binding-like beta-propeller repeat protein [Planctomycetales bacterium]
RLISCHRSVSCSGMELRAAVVRAALIAILCVAVSPVMASDWARFRGPNGSGISPDDKAPPTTWSDTENLKWKLELPGPGLSSPIVVGDRVFVTCWSGYAVGGRNSGQLEDLKRHLICVDRKSGQVMWNKTIDPVLPEEPFRGMFAENGYASHTPVSDGERVYAFFGKSGVRAYDLEGKELWKASVGTADDPRGWGTASSPVLYKNLLIVPATIESQALIAFDKLTGEQVWRQDADGFSSTWGTPVLVDVDDRQELVIGVPYEIWGLNPDNGKLRWYCEAMDTDSYCSSVVVADGVIYGVEGRSGGSVAVRPGGTDDVTKTHVKWTGRDRNRIGTPVVDDGLMYWISGGIAN